MLTLEQIQLNKIKYIELLSKLNIDLTALVQYLEAVNYFDAPYSTQFTGSYQGGLCNYALHLCHELSQLARAYFPNRYTEQDIIIVALLKDIYRAELYEPYLKNVNNNGVWSQVPAFKYKETRPVFGDLGFNSFMIARRYINLTDEQVEAITQSSVKESYAGDIHEILRVYPLVTLTKMAELATTYLEGDC